MNFPFIHLSSHTEYSFSDSLIRIKNLTKELLDNNTPAYAITDHTNTFALIKFYKSAKSNRIKPIIGSELMIKREQGDQGGRVILLCKNDDGYKNLTKLISWAYIYRQDDGIPYLDHEWLKDNTEGLIALSGGQFGLIGRSLINNKAGKAKENLLFFKSIFPNRFYLELHRCNRPGDENHLHKAINLAIETNTPVVATNDIRFIKKEDYYAHEIRVCIHDKTYINNNVGEERYSEEQYLKSDHEMKELFRDIPSAIENSWNIAQRCNMELTLGNNYLPGFPTPNNENIHEYFKEKGWSGLKVRMNGDIPQEYSNRLKNELEVIEQMGFAGYFLIVADFINWSKKNNIPVGPGRGSGAGSLVAYSLGITNIDPIPYDLLFERFLNPERVSMPDFDIDFCIEGRDAVINYVAERYGRERVSQIITYTTMAAKAVVRDVGRVLGYPYGFTDRISKLIPKDPGIKIKESIEQSKELKKLYKNNKNVKELINLSQKLEGLPRNAGKHAGGVVIAPRNLTEYTSLYCEEDGGDVVTQFDKDDIENIGLLKFDFLGLKTLTIIKWTLENININIDINNIPLDDQETFQKIFHTAKTTGVFQLESKGIKRLVKLLRADSFEELIALVALYRPGPLQSGMVDDFVNRKHGKMKIEYIHKSLEPILKNTYGVIVYQEQVMRIAQDLAGYTLGEADLLRRAMGKKKPEEMAKQRDVFVTGAKNNGITKEKAEEIFDLMDKFAGYGFNKSHSAGYALISYQTAWLKTHYTAEFMSATLSAEMNNLDKIARIINDCFQILLTVIPPDINESEYKFKAINKKTIIYGLGAIKGNGENVNIKIIEERKKHGKFINIFDLCNRVNLTKKSLENLIKSGSLDSFNESRSTLMSVVHNAINESKNSHLKVGQMSIFNENKREFEIIDEWDIHYKLQCEKEVLGHYMSGHPYSLFQDEIKSMCKHHLEIDRMRYDKMDLKRSYRLCGWCSDIYTHNSEKGEMAIVTLEDDEYNSIEVIVFHELYDKAKEIIKTETLLVLEGIVKYDNDMEIYKVAANMLMTIDQARKTLSTGIEIKISDKDEEKKIEQIIKNNPGKLNIYMGFHKYGTINHKKHIIKEMKKILGDENIVFLYQN